MTKAAFVISLALTFSANGWSQDLNRLQARAQKLLSLRSSVNIDKAQAAQYIESKGRQEFLEGRPLPMSEAHVTGFELTDDPKLVYVIFKAKVLLPEIGYVPRTGREAWIWENKDWFFHVEDAGNPFAVFAKSTDNAPEASPPKPLTFELSTNSIDFGKHVQGEVLRRTVTLKSDRNEVSSLRQPDLPGFLVEPIQWKSDNDGQFDVVLDTTLLSEDVHYPIDLEVIGFEQQRTHVKFEIAAAIEPRLRFTQDPPLLDPTKPGKVELSIQNLSGKSFRFLSVLSTNPSYAIKSEAPTQLNAGETLKLNLEFQAQQHPLGEQINITLSEPVLGRPSFVLPLKIKFPNEPSPEYTKEQLDQLIRRAR
jgi:hypothetical protein